MDSSSPCGSGTAYFITLTLRVVMSSSAASTTSLISTDRKVAPSAPPKDYAAAFAALQSSYGANGHAPVLPGGDGAAPVPVPVPVVLRRLNRNPSHPHPRPAPAALVNPWGSQTRKSGVSAAEGGLESESSSRAQKKGFKTAFAALRASCGLGAGRAGH
ncbi:hypothetical protein JB92DRAFT_3065743 [Gautieria morchelliformis]|nr:hypothetical protein JB92DRAFT_3065743 [Gautieria morchelliformis]